MQQMTTRDLSLTHNLESYKATGTFLLRDNNHDGDDDAD